VTLKDEDTRIHLKLKIEERAIISDVVFLFIWERVPILADKMIKGSSSLIFRKETKKTGASFCQVERMIILFHLELCISFRNQSWKGAAAILIIRELTRRRRQSFLRLSVIAALIIRRLDAID